MKRGHVVAKIRHFWRYIWNISKVFETGTGEE